MVCLLAVVLVTFSGLLPVIRGSALQAVDRNDKLGVIGGRAVSIEHAPYMAAVFFDLKEVFYWCGATIIHEQFLLTAASKTCRYRLVPEMRILVGTDNLDEKDKVFVLVEKAICHENKYNDISLLKLREPLQFGPKVAPIKLPNENFDVEAGAQVDVIGWGATDRNTENTDYAWSNTLNRATVLIESQDSCRKRNEWLTDNMVCAGSRDHDACWNDAGSPLTQHGVQVGIVSIVKGNFNERCGGENPTVYTRVSSYVDWIKTKIHENL